MVLFPAVVVAGLGASADAVSGERVAEESGAGVPARC
jgi:hypothetical protein